MYTGVQMFLVASILGSVVCVQGADIIGGENSREGAVCTGVPISLMASTLGS